MRHVADLLPPVGVALVRPTSSKAWDLRAAWAAGWRVSLTLDAADIARLEGHVTRVAATDAFVVLAGQHVPLDRVLAVHRPSLLGDSTHRPCPRHVMPRRDCKRCRTAQRWRAPRPAVLRVHEGQTALRLR